MMGKQSRRRKWSLSDLQTIAATLGESLAVQNFDSRPAPGDAGLILTKNSTDTRWFHSLQADATAMCLPEGRVVYPLQGSVLLYFGARPTDFIRLCRPIGECLVPMPKGGRA